MTDLTSSAMKADGFDGAIIGFGGQYGSDDCVVYSVELCIDILVERDGMDYDEARDFFDYNVASAYVGSGTPIFVNSINDVDELDEILGR